MWVRNPYFDYCQGVQSTHWTLALMHAPFGSVLYTSKVGRKILAYTTPQPVAPRHGPGDEWNSTHLMNLPWWKAVIFLTIFEEFKDKQQLTDVNWTPIALSGELSCACFKVILVFWSENRTICTWLKEHRNRKSFLHCLLTRGNGFLKSADIINSKNSKYT